MADGRLVVVLRTGSPPRVTNLNLGLMLGDPLGHPTPPSCDELERGLPVRYVVIFRGRCPGDLELIEGQVKPNRFIVGRHEVLEVEEVYKLLEPVEEREEVRVGGEDGEEVRVGVFEDAGGGDPQALCCSDAGCTQE